MTKLQNAVQLKEKKRVYTFPSDDKLVKVVLEKVTELSVSESGNHRLKADGKLHIIPVGWIHIEIDESEWTV